MLHQNWVGLGFRRGLIEQLDEYSQIQPLPIDFFELAPENWIGVGGRFGYALRRYTERFPFVAHGLSLSIGGPTPLDQSFLRALKHFLKTHQIHHYSEHLSYCTDEKGHLYDLLPLPFTEEAAHYVANRVKQVQEFLEMPIALENVSYYAAPHPELKEIEFIKMVQSLSNCDLLLDVNNIVVNAFNHDYEALEWMKEIPSEPIVYGHVAGHITDGSLKIDTHGAPVIDPVWKLLEHTYIKHGIFPTLVERDFNYPPLEDLLAELQTIRNIMQSTAHTNIDKNVAVA